MRRIIEAILYVLRSGCPWRLLPDSFPPWGTVYGWFSELRDAGVFESLNHHLVQRDAPALLEAHGRMSLAAFHVGVLDGGGIEGPLRIIGQLDDGLLGL